MPPLMLAAAPPAVLGLSLVVQNPPGIVEALRLIVSLGGGVAFGICLSAYVRERRSPWVRAHRPLYFLAILITALAGFGEAQQLGDPFIVYQLPGRAVAIVLAWLCLRRARIDRQLAGFRDT